MGPSIHDIEPERTSASAAPLAERLIGMVSGADARMMIGICGAPGAGKSTLADELAEILGPAFAVVVPFDGFHLARDVIRGTPRMERRGAIDTFDLGSYRALLSRLRSRDEAVVYAPKFDRAIEDPVASAIVVPRSVPLVITEGNYLLHDHPEMMRAREVLDEVWFLDTPPSVRLPQLIARHVAFGKPEPEAEAWALGTDQANAIAIEQNRRLADLILTVDG